MKFIVTPIAPKPSKLDTTMCMLCSEDPRACI